jgi:hypothetical protein
MHVCMFNMYVCMYVCRNNSILKDSQSGITCIGECGVPATTLLPMPYPATLNQPWWSYDVGLIHMIGISTEHNYTRDSPQYNWLKNDLRKVNRTLTPWILFNGHRPMYINSDYYGRSTHCILKGGEDTWAVSFFSYILDIYVCVYVVCVYVCTVSICMD